jgi:zinc-finger of transposase IS204/IS1001/IS1096/IS1165
LGAIGCLPQGGTCLSCPGAVELGILLPHLAGVVVEGAVAAAGLLLVLARARADEASCPACGTVSARVHSRYARRLADAAIGGRRVMIRLTVRRFFCPIVLPAPLDTLADVLAAGRKAPGTSLLSVPSPWLFPGRRPGSPLTEDALAQRLHALGISPRQARNTALFTLAADVPAAILAKTLSIHIKAAIQWQKISGGDWAAYAAGIGSRLEH